MNQPAGAFPARLIWRVSGGFGRVLRAPPWLVLVFGRGELMVLQVMKLRGRRRLVWLLPLLLLPTGCIKDYLGRLRGPGFDDRSKRMTSEIPAREEAGKPFSFSTKAQEIGRDFGFQ
jgi:hypothetical protein